MLLATASDLVSRLKRRTDSGAARDDHFTARSGINAIVFDGEIGIESAEEKRLWFMVLCTN